MEALKEICIKFNLYLFSDEAPGILLSAGKQTQAAEYVSAMHLQGLDQHVVLMDTISVKDTVPAVPGSAHW